MRSAALASGWDPIETAPRDGRLLLLRVPQINNTRRHSRPEWPDVTLGYYSERMVLPGWYSLEREADEYGSMLEMKVEPTAWLPSPT